MRYLPLLLAATALFGPTSAIPDSGELAALSDFYYSTGGSTSWTITSGWASLDTGSPSDPCGSPNWFGVNCSANGKHVTTLVLAVDYGLQGSGNGLDGSLPNSLANLTRLEVGVGIVCASPHALVGRACVCVWVRGWGGWGGGPECE